MLGYLNTKLAIKQHVSDTNKRRFDTIMTNYNLAPIKTLQNQTILINEAGLYELITKSKMPKARKFQEWILTEIIPSLNGNWIQQKPQINETTKCINELQIEDFKFGTKIVTFRYIIINTDTIWFVGNDVAKMLEYSNIQEAVRYHVSESNIEDFGCSKRGGSGCEKFSPDHLPMEVLQNHTKFINEAGLYELIMKSKMPKAKEFQTWVTSEVLPSLRKTGKYSMEQASMKDATNLNVINKAIENGANAQWYEEKLELLQKNRGFWLFKEGW